MVPVNYAELEENDAGGYYPEEDEIAVTKDLLKRNHREEHDETITHEIVHALQFKSSLRHLGISDDAWEVICGEVGRAVAQNFLLQPKKHTK